MEEAEVRVIRALYWPYDGPVVRQDAIGRIRKFGECQMVSHPRTIRGSRVMLRPLTVQDWPIWHDVRIRNREWVERWEPLPELPGPDPTDDKDAFKHRCAAWERQRQYDSAYGFGIFDIHTELLLGEVSLGTVQRGPFQNAYVGYWIDQSVAGTGLVPEAVVLVLRYAFEDLRLHRVEAAIVPRNEPSRRVAEKLGFRNEGISIRFLQIRGVWEDHVRYAMTHDEWAERREPLLQRWVESVGATHQSRRWR